LPNFIFLPKKKLGQASDDNLSCETSRLFDARASCKQSAPAVPKQAHAIGNGALTSVLQRSMRKTNLVAFLCFFHDNNYRYDFVSAEIQDTASTCRFSTLRYGRLFFNMQAVMLEGHLHVWGGVDYYVDLVVYLPP
jgi:hypothetical protein